jgi:DNA-binding NarL/FixJ family response regulator
VLTVDDHVEFRDVARDVIDATWGFESCADATCGEDALVAVDQCHPDLVLLDVRMPGIGGIETARRISAAHPEVLVVLVSVAEATDLPATVQQSGAAALVRKHDIRPDTLRALWIAHGAGE